MVLAVFPSQLCCWSFDNVRMYYNNAPYIEQEPQKPREWHPFFQTNSDVFTFFSDVFFLEKGYIHHATFVGRKFNENELDYDKDELIIIYDNEERTINAAQCFQVLFTQVQRGENIQLLPRRINSRVPSNDVSKMH